MQKIQGDFVQGKRSKVATVIGRLPDEAAPNKCPGFA